MSIAIKRDGTVYMWGDSSARFNDGTTHLDAYPTRVRSRDLAAILSGRDSYTILDTRPPTPPTPVFLRGIGVPLVGRLAHSYAGEDPTVTIAYTDTDAGVGRWLGGEGDFAASMTLLTTGPQRAAAARCGALRRAAARR